MIELEAEQTLKLYDATVVYYPGGFGIVAEAIAYESIDSNQLRFYRVSNYSQIGALIRLANTIAHFDSQANKKRLHGMPIEQAITNQLLGHFNAQSLAKKRSMTVAKKQNERRRAPK